MTTPAIQGLSDLRGLRSAPSLIPEQQLVLQQELRHRLAACDWGTIGIMAPTSEAALASLRSFEQALGWPRLGLTESDDNQPILGPVFLKGNQRTGRVGLRAEAGLGEGVLVTGHSDTDPDVEDTWGPFPLDFFPPAASSGATSL
ncbi:MAG: DUF1824 family protein [Cyanobacteriota bacterium]|nr:DUF1824 family protein [Cyanobacteriota bacterium]